jgi:hypothetical protein
VQVVLATMIEAFYRVRRAHEEEATAAKLEQERRLLGSWAPGGGARREPLAPLLEGLLVRLEGGAELGCALNDLFSGMDLDRCASASVRGHTNTQTHAHIHTFDLRGTIERAHAHMNAQ